MVFSRIPWQGAAVKDEFEALKRSYQPDLILWDGRSFTPTANAEWGAKQPTWFQISAAGAGAVVAWPAYWLHTYPDFATELDKLTEAVTAANENIGT